MSVNQHQQTPSYHLPKCKTTIPWLHRTSQISTALWSTPVMYGDKLSMASCMYLADFVQCTEIFGVSKINPNWFAAPMVRIHPTCTSENKDWCWNKPLHVKSNILDTSFLFASLVLISTLKGIQRPNIKSCRIRNPNNQTIRHSFNAKRLLTP